MVVVVMMVVVVGVVSQAAEVLYVLLLVLLLQRQRAGLGFVGVVVAVVLRVDHQGAVQMGFQASWCFGAGKGHLSRLRVEGYIYNCTI